MRIEVSVTPCSVAPLALPGPHGAARVPKLCGADELDVAPGLPVVVGDADVPR
jgi:hypothetical protein